MIKATIRLILLILFFPGLVVIAPFWYCLDYLFDESVTSWAIAHYIELGNKQVTILKAGGV